MNSLRVRSFLGSALAVAALAAASAAAYAGVFVSVAVAPPPLPVYVQPLCPGDGYIWTPGYWAWGPAGYYWVPGVWVLAPQVGYLWTPPYWGWSGGLYVFHGGYWGPHIGFYGGVNYGFGYFGHGYEGGVWVGDRFSYNRTYNNINVTNIHNTYVHNVTVTNVGNRTSFNGGAGGVQERPQASELAATREPHVQPTAIQTSHQTAAAQDRAQLASANGGRPGIAARSTTTAYSNVAARHAANQPIVANDRAGATNQRGGVARPNAQTSRPMTQSQSRVQQHAAPHPQAAPHVGGGARPHR